MRRHLPLLTLLGLVAAVPATRPGAYTLAPDAPQVVKDWWADQPRIRRAEAVRLQQQVKSGEAEVVAIKKARLTGQTNRSVVENKVIWTFEKSDSRRKHLAEAQASLGDFKARLAAIDDAVLFDDERPFGIGSLYSVSRLTVEQIIDPQTCRATVAGTEVWLVGLEPVTHFR